MDQYSETYTEEAYELLGELEADLMKMEENPNDRELIAGAFRAMHTIKGSGAMFGFTEIANFTHHVETAFDHLREGKIPVTKQLVDLSLSACDLIRQMVEGKTVDAAVTEEILASFREITSTGSPPSKTTASSNDGPVVETEAIRTYRIQFRPNLDIFSTGANPLPLLDELRDLGECKCIARTHNILPLNELDPESCYIFWDVVLTTNRGINAIKDVFIFVDDESEITIEVIDDDIMNEETDYKKLGKILVERGEVSEENLESVLTSQKRVGELLVEEKAIEPDAVDSALIEQQHVKQVRKNRQEKVAASSIRVPAEKLDALVDLVGELVTVQARLSQAALSIKTSELTSISEEVEHLTAELRDNTMGIRMLPIGTTFARFKRLVRDLSNELGKEIVLETEGGETELDKTVIERLNDPLVHLIRNSIDHGVESPNVRKHMGKSAEGTVRLTAAHQGAHVIINIEDDGAGLDTEVIRHKAVERGLVAPDADLADNEIFAQIFAPGFSTAKEVTDVSGRGVGMDVVKRSIDALQGSIDISSKKGVGTTITLKLPLTLAIIDGLMVRIGEGDYVFPLSAVEECVELDRKDANKAWDRRMMELRGRMISYLSMRNYFGVSGEQPPYEKIVIVESNGNKIGLGVDYVVGQHQTVIKSLGDVYRDVEGVSGATIKGDGDVALILDVNTLVQSVS